MHQAVRQSRSGICQQCKGQAEELTLTSRPLQTRVQTAVELSHNFSHEETI